MYLAHLSLADFRNYATAEVALEPGVTAFVGPNGYGKTNLVEAVGYLATQSSHRVASDAPLVRSGAQRAVVRGAAVQYDRQALIELEINPGKANRARLNRSPVPRAREVLGVVRTVLFAPEDLSLVKGDPDTRRRFMDDLLVVRAPRYAGVRQDYERILRQRNTLLKTAGAAARGRRYRTSRAEPPPDEDGSGGSGGSSGSGGKGGALATLDVWDTQLAHTGAELLAARLRLVEDLRPLVATAYAEVAPGRGDAQISYRSSFDLGGATDAAALEEVLAAEVARRRQDELERGVSLVGPHRDDLTLQLGELPAKGYASHGESWSYALALRLAAYDLLCADGGEPILILDDVFAELDSGRRARLVARVVSAEQALVTAAVAEDVPEELGGVRYDVTEEGVRRVP